MSRPLSEYYLHTLKDTKGKPPPNFDDTSRGVLLALIKERPTIWNSSAKLTKDDVLASFQQCSAVLSNMDSIFNIWAIIEKWCWVVESYVRCSMTSVIVEWRYNNTLEYLKPFASTSYPYLGCLSKKRRNELTELYADPEIIKVMEATEGIEFQPGIFREEMHFLSGEDHLAQLDMDAVARTVSMQTAKRRGRPSKADKRSPVDQFINLTPQSAQFQKLLESNGSTQFTAVSFSNSDPADDLGFTPAMYSALIEMIQAKPEIWQNNHAQKDDVQAQDQLFEEFARKLVMRFKDSVDLIQLEKMTGPFVRLVWDKLKERFKEEEKSDTLSKWKYFQPLQFLSTRLMPAFLLENVFIKSDDPSTSSGLSARVTITSPAGSSQSEDSRMATSSPSTSSSPFVGIPTVANGKSIKAVLDNLVARSMKDEQGAILQTDYSELKQILEQSKILKVDNENGPPLKRIKHEDGSSPGNSRMIVYNDARKVTQAPISTWVPPREDLTAKVKEENVSTAPQKRAQATAVIKSGHPLEKQLKKQNPQPMIPVTAASVAIQQQQQRNGFLGLNSMVIPQTAIQQALLKKMEPTTSIPSVSAPQLHQAQSVINGAMNGNAEPEDKWTLLGRMITMMAREVEARDPMVACELTRDLQQCLFTYNMKSLRTKESNNSSQ